MSSVGGSPIEATLRTPPIRGVSCAAAPASRRTTAESRTALIARVVMVMSASVATGAADDTIRRREGRRHAHVLNVLVTLPFGEARLNRLRAVSPELAVSAADPARADYARTDVLYAGDPPRELT